ncbi:MULTISPECIES: hypothetical protein [unclassified Streptomyces]|uniref:hypothetical protein n=1 Tax=unclassified Streptomyces TaxID=2593676 RepID=UPI002884935F|nr:hypothetical protein [Streptomyces sp. DSM 41633]
MRAKLTVVAALISAAGLTACSAPPSGDGEASLAKVEYTSPSAVPAVAPGQELQLPIDPYLVKQAERAQILKASRLVAADCMRGFGIELPAPPLTGGKAAANENATNMDRRYGIYDDRKAAQFGYSLPEQVEPEGAGQTQSPLSDAENRVFLGDADPVLEVQPGEKYNGKEIPPGGCAGEARRKIGDGLRQEVAGEINFASFQRSLTDPQVTAAFKQWSECMKERGYSFNTPLEPFESAGANGAGGEAETKMASYDVECKTRVNLIGAWFAVESEIQKQMIGKREEALHAASKEREKTIKNAAAMVAAP